KSTFLHILQSLVGRENCCSLGLLDLEDKFATSSCSAMMWTICNPFNIGGKRGNRIFAVFVSIFTFVLGLFSFSELIGVFYPLVGYLGLLYIACVAYKGIKRYIKIAPKKKEGDIPSSLQ
ncbi:MAG: hypothetical protein PHC45_10760, partial [Clostridiaceae bacterium]|nr:hypothetical protein [Clostridiaceae bacterium]